MIESSPATTSRSPLGFVLNHPELTIAAGTIWMYFVARSYISGFLSLYNVEASWFSPSLFVVISFAGPGILASIGLAVSYFGAVWAAAEFKRAGIGIALAWLLLMLTVGVWAALDFYGEYESLRNCYQPLLWTIGVGIAPLGVRARMWIDEGRSRRLVAGAARAMNLAAHSPEGISAKDAGELAELYKEARTVIAKAEKGSLYERYPWTYLAWACVTAIWIVTSVATTVGFQTSRNHLRRLEELAAISFKVQETIPEAAAGYGALVARPIFTDGTASLMARPVEGQVKLEFRASPESQPLAVMTSSHLRTIAKRGLAEAAQRAADAVRRLAAPPPGAPGNISIPSTTEVSDDK